MEDKIEKGVPLPKRQPRKAILEKLEVGDSIHRKVGSITSDDRAAYWTAARHLGIQIAIRSTDDGYRIWRIK